MRFLILNTDYPAFLADLFAQNPGLGERSYNEQLQTRMETFFGLADFYSFNLRALGHDAHDVLMNNHQLQLAWVREHGEPPRQPRRGALTAEALARRVWRTVPKPHIGYGNRLVAWADHALDAENRWLNRIVEQQIEHLRPDVVLNQAPGYIPAHALARLRNHYGVLVGQVASPIPEEQNFHHYDLMLSSLPNVVRWFRVRGVDGEFHRLGFEPRVLQRLEPEDRDLPCSFVGQISAEHSNRFELLEQLCAETPLKVWSPSLDLVPQASSIRPRYRGRAWGLDMYRVLARSQVTLNYHLDYSASHANNLRLYEATGVGSLLVTDMKSDLADLFLPGKEVVAYKDSTECMKLITHYLNNPEEREEIARAGQRRTLETHNYAVRMAELVEIVERHG